MPAIANITKVTGGSLNRRVKDVIQSNIVVSNTGTTTPPSCTVIDNIPVPGAATRTWTATGAGGAIPANAAGVGAINEVSAGIPPGGSITYIVLDTMTVNTIVPFVPYANTASYNDAENPIVSATGASIQVQDNMTIAESVLSPSPRYVGDVIHSTLQIFNHNQLHSEVGIDIISNIPVAPPGTTRTWTATAIGGSILPPYPPAGVGNINLTGRTFAPVAMIPAGVTFDIFDTVNNVGLYLLCGATVRGGTTDPAVRDWNTIPCAGVGSPPTITILPSGSNMQLTKVTAGSGTRNIGDVITSTITLTNTGNLPGTPINLNDAVPVSPPGTTRTWSLVSSGVTPVPPGAGVGGVGLVGLTFAPFTSSLTLTINDTVGNSGNYVNNANTTGAVAISTNGQNVTVLAAPAPNTNTTKVTAGGPYTVGVPIVSTVTVSNTGTGTEVGYSIVDPIPFGVTRTFTSIATGGSTGNTPAGVTAIGDVLALPAGGTVTYTINDTPTVPGTYQNIVTANGGPPIPGGPVGVVNPAAVPNTATTKTTAAGPFTVGQVVTSTVTVSNTGTGPEVGYTIVDAIPVSPAGTTRTFTSVSVGGATGNTPAGVTGINDVLNLPAGSSVTYTINDTVNATGTYQNTVIPDGGAPITGGPVENVTNVLSIICPPAQFLTVGVTAPAVFALGAGGNPPFVFSASGLPAGMSINPATGEITGTPIIAQPATPVTVTVTDSTLATANCVYNATVSNPAISDPAVTKSTAGGSPRLPGDVIVSTVIVSNPAPGATAPAIGLIFNDPVPAVPPGTTRTYTSVAAGGATGNTVAGVGNISDILNLPINATVTYTISDTVVVTGIYQNVATVTGEPPAVGAPITIFAPPLVDCDCTPASLADIQVQICNIRDQLDDCCGNLAPVRAATLQTRLAALQAQLLICLTSNTTPVVPEVDAVLLCSPTDGRPVIVRVAEPTGAATYYEADGVTPYVGPTPIACGGLDIEQVDLCHIIIVPGAYGAIGDRIKEIRWFDTSVIPPTQVAQVFINENTGLVVTGITPANSEPCGTDAVRFVERGCVQTPSAANPPFPAGACNSYRQIELIKTLNTDGTVQTVDAFELDGTPVVLLPGETISLGNCPESQYVTEIQDFCALVDSVPPGAYSIGDRINTQTLVDVSRCFLNPILVAVKNLSNGSFPAPFYLQVNGVDVIGTPPNFADFGDCGTASEDPVIDAAPFLGVNAITSVPTIHVFNVPLKGVSVWNGGADFILVEFTTVPATTGGNRQMIVPPGGTAQVQLSTGTEELITQIELSTLNGGTCPALVNAIHPGGV